MSVLYHPNKANVVKDALSCMSMGSVTNEEDKENDLVCGVHTLALLEVQLVDSPNSGFMIKHRYVSSLILDVKSKQHLDPILVEFKESMLKKSVEAFSLWGNKVLRYQCRLCVLDVYEFKRKFLEEAHGSRYSIHPKDTIMFLNLWEVYW